MKKLFPPGLILITLLVLFASPGHAQWTNGQDALLVIGQPDFISSCLRPFSHDPFKPLKTWQSTRPTANCMWWMGIITGYFVLPTRFPGISRLLKWFSGNPILFLMESATSQNTFFGP